MPTRDSSIEIAVGDGHIAGTLIAPATSIPGVLCVHGWGGSQQQYLSRAREIAALGCVSLTFDLRGHARTEPQQAHVSREDNLCDVLAAYDELRSHRTVDERSIAVVGSSYGGYLAAILTTVRPVRWLALRVPALYEDAGWAMPKKALHKAFDLHAYRRRALEPGENRALAACAKFKGDVLIVESEHDDIVPHRTIENFVEACTHARSLTYRVIGGADHGLTQPVAQRAYTEVLVNWLTEMVFGARASAGVARGAAHAGAAAPERAPHPG
jgi:pimeloyl-ACP methyl ester carboxylesterase